MKIFFIIPPRIHYIEPYAYAVADKSNEARVSLGLLYIAAQLKKTLGIDIKIIDSPLDRLTLDDLEMIVREQKPDFVGFSVLTFNLLNCIEVSRIIKKCSPTTKICYGGWHPTLYPEETLKLDWVDYIVIGEGEITFTDLISNKKLDKINGLGFKINKKIVINPPRDIIRNLDEIPFPAYNLIDINRYSNLLASSNVVMTIMTSRGCPHQCIFCDLRKTPIRFRSPANIMEEIIYWAKKGLRNFSFRMTILQSTEKGLLNYVKC